MGIAQTIRVIVFRQGQQLFAQCLEHDIAVQADDIEVLRRRIELALEAESSERGGDLSSIGPAPDYYFRMWREAKADLTPHRRRRDGKRDVPVIRMALCA
jgi:hypothetical protein